MKDFLHFAELPRVKGIYEISLMLAIPTWDHMNRASRRNIKTILQNVLGHAFDHNRIYFDEFFPCSLIELPWQTNLIIAAHVLARKPLLYPLESEAQKRERVEWALTSLIPLGLSGISHHDVVLRPLR